MSHIDEYFNCKTQDEYMKKMLHEIEVSHFEPDNIDVDKFRCGSCGVMNEGGCCSQPVPFKRCTSCKKWEKKCICENEIKAIFDASCRVLLEDDGATLRLYPNFVSASDLEDIKQLKLETRPKIIVYGKECRQQRNVGFFSDSSLGYSYSRQMMSSQPTTPFLRSKLDQVNVRLGTAFNGILVNEYPDGNSNIGAHSDDESGLDRKTRSVAAISYGAERIFRIRDKKTKKIVLDLETPPLSMLVMSGTFQDKYMHEIPVRKNKNARWSLTFRHHTT